MKEMKIFVILMMISHNLFSSELNPTMLRTLYYNASQKSSDAEKFYNLLKDATTDQPLIIGYKGMAEFMKCYHSINPVTKLSYFYRGKSDLDEAILLEPQNAELHYLRFTVQTNVPVFLNYKSRIEEDKQFLIKNMSSIKSDSELHKMICEYMMNSNYCTDSEKNFFKNAMRS